MSTLRRRMIGGKSKIKDYLCFTALEDGEFSFDILSGLDTTKFSYLEYSLNGRTWIKTNNVNSEAITITTPTIKEGDKVYWRGWGIYLGTSSNNVYSHFSSTGKFSVSGNISSMVLGKDFDKATQYRRTLGTTHGSNKRLFYGLFYNCVNLIDAHELILPNISFNYIAEVYTSLFKGCTALVDASFDMPTVLNERDVSGYNGMFSGCTALIHTPNFKMTEAKSSDFSSMFSGCTSLSIFPNLKSIKTIRTSSYASMFKGCTSLVSVSTDALPATSIGSSCYSNMFNGCTNLTTVPELPATTLATYCYEFMFKGCSSLENVMDVLPATTLAETCYKNMFASCTKLKTAPKIKATIVGTQSCYSMFDRCSALTYIFCMVIDLNPSNGLQSWLYGVPNNASCIFVKHIDATWTTTGTSGVLANWTVIYYDPTEDKYYTDQTKATECDDHGNPI